MNEMILFESASLRQQLCTDANTSILEKIGQLVFLPGNTFCTGQSIALFYQVDLNTLQQVIKRHRSELEQDGYKIFTYKELQSVHPVHFGFKIPNRGLALFPRRAILRLGMLLRDSSVARLIRSYLLNIEEEVQIDSSLNQTLNRIVQQLDDQAGHLIEHADCFANQANELKNHARQLKIQTEMIKALLEESYENRKRLETVEKKVDLSQERLNALEQLTQQITSSKTEEYLSEEQVHLLKERVNQRRNPQKIWSKLKKQFEVTRYKYLHKSKFREILDWLENYKEEN